jgi:hypothetical protein
MARAKTKKAAKAERPGLTDPTAPLDGAELLTAARPVLALLREDLAVRAKDTGVDRALQSRHEAEKKANRTADSFSEWREGILAQVAASWFLSCVFVRTLEDRGLLGQARLAGPGATDSQALFFQLAPSLTERDYLLFVFRELAELPAAADLFDRQHALVWHLSPSAEAAKELLRFFRSPTADTPAFRFGQRSTRFLGDLYQDLYEDVRKRYALLQTPDFIESFILDRTLEPAIERFGLEDTTLIDPTCGSGHFLLGAFDRLFDHRQRAQPDIDVRQTAYKALDAVYGADINPYAVAIARVRLILSYLDKAEIRRIKDAPALPLHLVVADSLLHNPQHVQQSFEHIEGQTTVGWRAESFQLEHAVAARDVLHRHYAAVVGNPPYITEKDSAKREVYRAMYPRSAAGKYALSAPFCERFFQLAREGGFAGQITANSFMKREFGKKLVEECLPTINLELIVNTSGAYIPGHGTPTVLIFGTHEPPLAKPVLTVLAKRGEPSTPHNPGAGQVWSSIATHWNERGFENDYISIADTVRATLATHPWSLGGGGAVELKALLEERATARLGDIAEDIGFASFTGLDDAFIIPAHTAQTLRLEPHIFRPLVSGETVRDWAFSTKEVAIAPYATDSHEPVPLEPSSNWGRLLWRYRTIASNVASFGGKTREQEGQNWWEWYRWQTERYQANCRIAFSEVATHNHFALDSGGKAFNRTAPIIKLPKTATEDDHLALLAYLNSSTACFWMKQVCHAKGNVGYGGSRKPSQKEGARAEAWEQFFAFSGTAIARLPLPPGILSLAALARELTETAAQLTAAAGAGQAQTVQRILTNLATLQERLDWQVYDLFRLLRHDTSDDVMLPTCPAGSRPFEMLLANRAAAGEPTAWFTRNSYSPPPQRWGDYERYVAMIETNSELALLESPEFKRRWLVPDVGALHSASQLQAALSTAESSFTTSVQVRNSLCQSGMALPEFAKAISEASVPFAASLRFAVSGLEKFGRWQDTWEDQRRDDAGERVTIGIPPTYIAQDFASPQFWQLRGKLDLPKERFISYPGCESDEDGEPVYGWAGWDQLQRAQALASLYQKRKVDEGWTAERLTPMLAGLLELLPWVKQWHNEPNAEFGGLRMGDYFEQFLDGECQLHHLTRGDLEAWRPPKASRKPAAPRAPKVAKMKAAAVDGDAPKTKRGRKPKAAAAAPTDIGPADSDRETDPS